MASAALSKPLNSPNHPPSHDQIQLLCSERFSGVPVHVLYAERERYCMLVLLELAALVSADDFL